MTAARIVVALICCAASLAFTGGAAAADAAPAPTDAPAATAGSPSTGPAAAAPAKPALPVLLPGRSALAGGECVPGGSGALAPVETSNCTDCDSPQGYCSGGDQKCRNYCLGLVGEIGMCSPMCNCCICPELAPPPPPPGDPGYPCEPVCDCSGAPGAQGLCPFGCAQTDCIFDD